MEPTEDSSQSSPVVLAEAFGKGSGRLANKGAGKASAGAADGGPGVTPAGAADGDSGELSGWTENETEGP